MGWSELVDTLRDHFQRKYSDNITNGLYDQRDVDRLQNDFRFARSFIRGKDRLEEGADLIHASFAFRKDYKIHDVTEDMFTKDMLNLGALYFRAKDINGSRILWLKVHLHRKDATPEYLRMEKLGLVSAIEKAFNEEPLKQVVVLLDMSNCGLVNMDIDLVKFIITCFKFHYPTFLDCMLIYDMPWIFNAAWKIVKAWLSAEAAAKIKFVTKSTIQTYITAESLPTHMGGTDDYKFVYTPGMSLEPLYPEEDKQDEKKVTFESTEPIVEEVTISTQADMADSPPPPQTHTNANATKNKSIRSNSLKSTTSNSSLRHRHSIPTNVNNNSKNSVTIQKPSTNNTYVGRFLSISPAEQLCFTVSDSGDSYDVISLSNTLPQPVAFKVKTTSPEKYRVRPSSGIVRPGKTEEVFVYLTAEHTTSTTVKDKFLIMAMEVASGQNLDDAAKLWRDAPKDSIMEHRLQCTTTTDTKKCPSRENENVPKTESKLMTGPHYDPDGQAKDARDSLKCITANKNEEEAANDTAKTGTQQPNLDEKVDRLELQNHYMRRQLNVLIALQISTAVFFMLIMLSYSCFGEELFTRFLALPFNFCSDSYGRKC